MPRGLESWGRVFAPQLRALDFADRSAALPEPGAKLLAYGSGRSYGDSCLNHGEVVLRTRGLARFISFDAQEGVLACESGVTLDEAIAFTLPRGWFAPVVPGTRWVTVGGAIANDVHGKNHHRAGSFGHHVRRFELLRSDGTRRICSRGENPELFHATLGGLGLTGLVTWAEIGLAKAPGPWIEQRTLRFEGLEEFFEASERLDRDYPYVVAWIDCAPRSWGRGVLFAGAHAACERPWRPSRALALPWASPVALVNRWTVRAFNELYYRAHRSGETRLVPYEPFFFPLDRVGQWNRAYGPRGFFQHQSVVPAGADGRAALNRLLEATATQGFASFLAVLKRLGDRASEGLLSFPMPGYTLALDFANSGPEVLAHLEHLDAIVREAGGRLYPAKDARMSAQTFERSFPLWREFARHVDPAFSSSFWRRVTAAESPHYAWS